MKLLKLLSIMIVGITSSNAATIAVGGVTSATSGLQAVAADGTVLSSGGYYIAVGAYNVVPTVAVDLSNLLTSVDAMTIFQTRTSPTLAGNTQGTITGSFVANGFGSPESLNGKQIYFVVGNGATRALSTDFAIFTNTTAAFFPSNVNLTTSVSVTLSSINSIVPLANAGLEDNNGTARDRIQLVSAIPEPSAALLGAVGALVLLRRRRI